MSTPTAQENRSVGPLATAAARIIDRGKHSVLGVNVDAVNYGAVVERIIQAAHTGSSMAVSALAVHGVMTGALDATHRYRLNRMDMVVPDGQPVRWALNLLHGTGLRERVYGPTLTLRVCERAAAEGIPIYLYGSRQRVLDALCRNLRERFPALQVAGAAPSRFRRLSPEEKQEVVEKIRRSGAGLTFVGLGCPRQEVWAYEYRDALRMPVIAVGAAFDFHAGLLPQAPASMQRAGLEWLFRLQQEPRRLWRRYLLLNPAYLAMLALQAAGVRRFDPVAAVPPNGESSYG